MESRFREASLRGEDISSEKKKEYLARIHYELEIIEGMGFKGYFHIVHDFIRWAKKNNIPVGPGRGSGASSLVSYCLGITDLDPMPLNLIFERFLNPERISMPDFDIDFCQENRFRVIEYITEKYGSDCSSHVITYGRLSVRAAIRDVGRVLGLGYSEVDRIAKLIPDVLGITLKEALKKEPLLKEMAEEDPKVGELIQLTALLEGLIRHVGIHAAGIIIMHMHTCIYTFSHPHRHTDAHTHARARKLPARTRKRRRLFDAYPEKMPCRSRKRPQRPKSSFEFKP